MITFIITYRQNFIIFHMREIQEYNIIDEIPFFRKDTFIQYSTKH